MSSWNIRRCSKMNAGAWGSEISNFLVSVDVIDSKGNLKH